MAVLLPAVAFTVACRHPEPPADDQRSAAPATAASSTTVTPVDRLAPDELLAGGERAFGIVLPRVLTVKGRFVDVVYTEGSASVHALALYFRPKLEGGSMREGSSTAVFEHVKVRGTPGLELSVHIVSGGPGATVELRDTTPPVAPSLPDEAARWRQVGLTPNGRIADPTHLD